ncbi:MAG: acyl-CoA thioesterase [Cytophagales bacterium]
MEDKLFKPVAASKTTLTELMIPAYSNFGGKIHGGILLSLMDKVAYACASKHAENYCVTASIDTVDFLQPVEVGEMVYMHASVNHVGKTSMVIGIKVVAEDFKNHTVKHTNTSFFTMVSKGDDGKPLPVPGLILETKEEARRFLEAIKRKELKKTFNTELNNIKTNTEVESEIFKLANENCQLAWKP